jgi:hypothetical protein
MPCEETSRLVREALGDRLERVVAKQKELEARYEAIKAGCTLPESLAKAPAGWVTEPACPPQAQAAAATAADAEARRSLRFTGRA